MIDKIMIALYIICAIALLWTTILCLVLILSFPPPEPKEVITVVDWKIYLRFHNETFIRMIEAPNNVSRFEHEYPGRVAECIMDYGWSRRKFAVICISCL
jgi:hypothetical protein